LESHGDPEPPNGGFIDYLKSFNVPNGNFDSRPFAEKSLFMVLLLMLYFPSWLKLRFEPGEFGFSAE